MIVHMDPEHWFTITIWVQEASNVPVSKHVRINRNTGPKKGGRPRGDPAWRNTHDGTEWRNTRPGRDGSGAGHTQIVRYGLEQALALKDQIHENQLLRVANLNNNATNKSIVQTLLPF